MADASHLACLEVRGGNVPADVELRAPGLVMHVVSRPYEDAAGGGDVHFVSSCGTGRITRLMVADVAGHGAEVDRAAGVLQGLMRRYINRIDARQFVGRMNDEFVRLTESGCFATAVVITYFAPTRRLSLINCGHPPPLLYRAASRQWSLVEDDAPAGDPTNLPLGVLDATRFEPTELTLEPGDSVACYTDSLPESRDAGGELLGYERLRDIVRHMPDDVNLSAWLNGWLDDIDAISPGNLRADDLTVLLLRATNGPAQSPLARRASGIGRMFLAPLRGRAFPWPEFTLKNLGGSILPWLSGRGR